MLRAKYYQDFKGHENCILIIGDADDYRSASTYFGKLNGGHLVPSESIQIEKAGEENILLTKKRVYILCRNMFKAYRSE